MSAGSPITVVTTRDGRTIFVAEQGPLWSGEPQDDFPPAPIGLRTIIFGTA